MSVDHELFGDRLPTYLTRFVGRQRELAELEELFCGARLLTICGVGGLGKTRLAIELARVLRTRTGSPHDFDDVFWVPLVAVVDPDTVPEEVAAGVGLGGVSGVRALLGAINMLRGRRSLLVLDNCEQVAAACAELVAALRREAVDIVVLATSRIALNAPDEEVYAVPPMGADAIELFVDRATSVAPTYALTEHNTDPIGQICEQLAGLPLAIELTASWVRSVSPLDLLDQLAETMQLVPGSGVVADRHRDLNAVLDSSWRWLSASDQAVATALGVFHGGFTRDAAECIAGASLSSLATLTERSLIQRLPDAVGGSRYQLHELIRTHAVERLTAAGPAMTDGVRSRHLDYFLRLAEGMDTPEHRLIDPTLDSPIAREQANLNAAMSWALDRGDAERALRITDALDAFYPYSRPRNADRVAHLTRALDIPWTRSSHSGEMAKGKALNRLGYIYVDENPDRAREVFRTAADLFAAIADQVGLANSLRGLGWCAFAAGDLEGFARDNRRALILAREIGDDMGVAWALHSEGIIYGLRGDLSRATAEFDAGYAIFQRNQGFFGMYRVKFRLAEALRRHRQWRESVEAFRSAFDLSEARRFTTEGGDLLEGLSFVAAVLHRGEDAARLAGAGDMWRAVYDERSRIYWPYGDADRARVRSRLGDAAWNTAYADGGRLTTEAAVRLAHDVLHDLTTALPDHPAHLTDRELEVLRLVAEGLNNTGIAERLVLSPRTVHAHLRSIFTKLSVTTRTAAAYEAVRLHVV